MSLLPPKITATRPPKQTKEERAIKVSEYNKKYRATHAGELSSKDLTIYYKKKYGLDAELTEKYGQYSGEVFKLCRYYDTLLKKCPELKIHINAELDKRSPTPGSLDILEHPATI